MRRPPAKPTKRYRAVAHAFYSGDLSQLPEPKEPAKPRQSKPRAEREAGAMDAIKDWRRARGDVRLWRNNVGVSQTQAGGWLRYGLCTGSSDFVGLRSIVISPAMVGKRVAVFFALEVKAPGGELEPHQETWLNEIKDAGGIAGVACNAQDAEDVLARHAEGLTRG